MNYTDKFENKYAATFFNQFSNPIRNVAAYLFFNLLVSCIKLNVVEGERRTETNSEPLAVLTGVISR